MIGDTSNVGFLHAVMVYMLIWATGQFVIVKRSWSGLCCLYSATVLYKLSTLLM